jgi:outer membrane protein TolC
MASAQHKISLAHKAKLPDFTVTATTESMPGAERTPIQVGVGLNLPFNQAWRRAQIVGTQSLLSYTQAQYAQTESDLQVEQGQNWLALEAAIAQSTLYRKQIHPAAEQLLAAAEAGYIAGQEDFLVVLLAQRQRFRLQLEHKKVIAESWKAWASLQLATGGIPLPKDLSNTKGGRQ